LSRGCDALRDVHGDAPDVPVHELDFAGVQTDAELHVPRAKRVANRGGAADSTRRSVEGGEESVTRGLHFSALKVLELASHRGVVFVEKLSPATISQHRRVFRARS
jgi:hypothetical protein